jgi:hypothetical protein
MRIVWVAAVSVAMLSLVATSCSKLGDTVNASRDKIFNALKSQGVYERGNLPVENPPTQDQIKGWFDIIGGAYRHIVNEENRTDRGGAEYEIRRGDSIAFMFDARIFTGSNYNSMQTFYTNIASRISEIAGNNSEFNGNFWPTDPLRIKVGDDGRILKSLQEALISCRAGDGNPDNDDEEDNIDSDIVRVYLTPDIAFGDRTVYNVPASSTIVFEVTDIEIIK